ISTLSLHDALPILRHLVEPSEEKPAVISTPSILVAEDLTPSDTASLDSDMILGLVTAKGGPTSHTAIIARGLGLPAVVGAGEEVLRVPDGTLGILDGESGKLYLKPSEADVQTAKNVQHELQQQQDTRSEEHTSELQYANISYAVFCLKK